MASSSSPTNSSIPLATLLEWYKIRDTFFGHNEASPNIPLAIEMAASCNHPEARWLAEVCENVISRTEAERLFRALGENDARGRCYAWLCGNFFHRYRDLALLRRSAELGFALAQALMATEEAQFEQGFKFALLAAAQGERDGYFQLGMHLANTDPKKAKENLLLACELGHVLAMVRVGELLEDSDPRRWRWWGQAASIGSCGNFLFKFEEQVERFNSGTGSAAIMFLTGRALRGQVNETRRTIFKSANDAKFDSWVGPAKQAIAFYEAQIQATKHAMHAWIQVGIRWKVVKDVRKLIAKLIWDSREEALYGVSGAKAVD